MTATEESVPLAQRYLVIEGHVSAQSLPLVISGLGAGPSPRGRILFVSFAYADVPLGKTFNSIFPEGRPEEAKLTVARIEAVTQQFGKPFDEIPHGWKTVCLIEFPHGIPGMIAALPTVDAWHLSNQRACLADSTVVDALATPRR